MNAFKLVSHKLSQASRIYIVSKSTEYHSLSERGKFSVLMLHFDEET